MTCIRGLTVNWNENVLILTKLPSLATLEGVILSDGLFFLDNRARNQTVSKQSSNQEYVAFKVNLKFYWNFDIKNISDNFNENTTKKNLVLISVIAYQIKTCLHLNWKYIMKITIEMPVYFNQSLYNNCSYYDNTILILIAYTTPYKLPNCYSIIYTIHKIIKLQYHQTWQCWSDLFCRNLK